MLEFQRWSNGFIAIFTQASVLRSVCFPLINNGTPGWESTWQTQTNIHKQELEDISKKHVERLEILRRNYYNNGREAFPKWIKNNWSGDGPHLMKTVYNYMNDNFDDGSDTKWNVIVIGKKGQNFCNPGLMCIDGPDRWQVIVGRGSPHAGGYVECDETYWPFTQKFNYCWYIGGLGVSVIRDRYDKKPSYDYYYSINGLWADQNGISAILAITKIPQTTTTPATPPAGPNPFPPGVTGITGMIGHISNLVDSANRSTTARPANPFPGGLPGIG